VFSLPKASAAPSNVEAGDVVLSKNVPALIFQKKNSEDIPVRKEKISKEKSSP
jgi:hypothetical protein